MYTLTEIKDLLRQSPKQKLVFPEGQEAKIQSVAKTLVAEELVEPILIFTTKNEVPADLDSRIQVVVMEDLDKKPFIDEFLILRKEKADWALASKMMQLPAYIGAMMVKMDQVQGMVCGLTFTTADTLRPALQIIKTKPHVSLAASVVWMHKEGADYFFADCALNINPAADQLVDITKMAVEFATNLGVKDPEAVLLSYSSKGSGQGVDAEKVREACALLVQQKPNFVFDGELQFDAAIIPEVRAKKAPNSPLKKPVPDVFIFPELQSGNIGYKIAQRWGGFEAFGPFILGLNQPVNDLSRGATLEDVLQTAILTAFQVLKGTRHDSSR